MPHRLLLLLSTIVCSLASVSCTHTFRSEGARGALDTREPVRVVVHSDDSGDKACRRAVEREMRSRGFEVVEGEHARLQVRMADNWRWDLVMYLKELELIFTDAKTGALKAQAFYRNSAWHTFPSGSRVIEKLFRKMDEQGVFQKRAAAQHHPLSPGHAPRILYHGIL